MSLKQKKKNEKKKSWTSEIKGSYSKFFKYIEDESTGIDYDLFEDCFSFSVPSAFAKKLFE